MSLLSGMLFLTACGQASPAIQTAPIPVVDEATSTSSPVLTSTSTSVPTETPTATITPLPTIPTFTPTFDASTIVTVTPAPKAECPKENNVPQVSFATYPSGKKYVDHPTIAAILGFLNSGGQMEQLDSELRQIDSLYSIKDVTNDGIPDLMVVSGSVFQAINSLWCHNGQYNFFPKDSAEAKH